MADDGGPRARMLAGESVFTPELGAAICARVAAGESLMAVCGAPEMPHRSTVRNWATRNKAFAADLWDAMRAARLERRRLDREVAAAKAGLPRPAKGGSESRYTVEIGEAICLRLANGESLISIARDPQMPCYGTIYGWLKRHADFLAAYVEARQIQADFLFDEAREVALGATPKTVWADRLRFDTIRWMTARMAPKKYCERLVVDAEVSARRAEAAAADPERAPMTVIVKRFCDVTPEDEAAAAQTEAWYEARDRGRGRGR